MHLDQCGGAATAGRLVVQEIQIGQAAQRATNGALMRPRRAQIHELASSRTRLSLMRDQSRGSSAMTAPRTRRPILGPRLPAGFGHSQRHAVSRVVVDPGP